MLWGMFWFIFAIVSGAYSSGLPGISHQYSIATRAISLAFALALAIIGIVAVYFFYGIWHLPTARVTKPQSTPLQFTTTAINMITAQGGNPLMQLSGDQRVEPNEISELQPVQAGRPSKSGYGFPQSRPYRLAYHTPWDAQQTSGEASERSQAEPVVHRTVVYQPTPANASSMAPPYSSAPGYSAVSVHDTQPGTPSPGGAPAPLNE